MELVRMAFDQVWQLTTLVIVVWLTVRMVARNRPHLAYVLWLVVLLKAVTPPVWSSPTGVFSWVQASIESDASPPQSPEIFHPSPPSVASRPILIPSEVAQVPAKDSATELAAPRLTSHTSMAKTSRATIPHVRRGLVAIWCVGLVGTLIVTLVRWCRCMWLLRVLRTVDRPDLDELVAKLSLRLRVGRRVRLLVTTGRIGPAVIGLFRPLIVLPEIIVQGKQADELEAIIAHELLHVRRGDLWLGLLQVCAKAVWWFHPLVGWASRMSTQEAERCCDEELIGELRCDPKRYARSLLEVLELKRMLRTIPVFPGMKPVEVTSQRLERIMRLGQGCHKRTPRWCWAVMLLLTLGVLPGAALVLATDPPMPSSTNADDELQVVAARADVHDADAQTVEITVKIFRAPQRVVDAAISDWTVAWTELNDADDRIGAARHAGRQPELPLPDADSPLKAVSGRAIEARLPALYKIIDDQEAAAISHRILQDRHANKLTEPRVNVFSGQSVSVVDATHRPFVVGFRQGGQPQIRVVTEGTTLHLRPSLFDDARIGLAFDLKLTRITDVSTATFSLAGRKEPVTFQIPEVETTSVESSLTFPSGKTLLIGGLTTKDEKGERQARLVMLKATRNRTADRKGRPMLGSGVTSDVGVTGHTVVRDESSAPIFAAVYNVADLLKHDLDWLDQPEVAELTHSSLESRAAATLIAAIVEQVKPESWSETGGRGAIEAFLTNQSLVVSQTDAVHRNVATFLTETRKRLGISAEIPRNPPLHVLRSKQELRQNENVYPKVYNVADLVIPVPSVVRAPEALPRYGKIPNDVQPDFETLIDLITSTVAPDNWDRRGGFGAIEPFPTNLSLVIAQTETAHDQIADLLERLRHMQDVQVTIETRLLHVPKSLLPPEKLPGFVVRDVAELDASGVENVGKPMPLSATEVGALLQGAEDADGKVVSLPKITLFNGQQAAVSTEKAGLSKSTIQYQATSSADHQSVFLKVATEANTQLGEVASETVESGGSLLLRIDESTAATWNSEVTPTEHVHLLLVTPKVIVVGE